MKYKNSIKFDIILRARNFFSSFLSFFYYITSFVPSHQREETKEVKGKEKKQDLKMRNEERTAAIYELEVLKEFF